MFLLHVFFSLGSTVHCIYGVSPPPNPGQNPGQKPGQKSDQKYGFDLKSMFSFFCFVSCWFGWAAAGCMMYVCVGCMIFRSSVVLLFLSMSFLSSVRLPDRHFLDGGVFRSVR